jgi:glutathione S-transferase
MTAHIPTNCRLITIPISHYCEKVRWTLDYLNIPFQEVPCMPPFSRSVTAKYGGTTVPLFATDKDIVTDSRDIIRYLDTLMPGKLYPIEPELLLLSNELEILCDDVLGVHARRWGYSHALIAKLIYPRWTLGAPIWQKLLFPFIFPVVRSKVREMFDINATSASESYQEILRVFDRIEDILADGRRYLLGDRLTAIDIIFASLAAPILQPPEHPIPSAALDLLPVQMQQDIHHCQTTTAGKFGLRLYRESRQTHSD